MSCFYSDTMPSCLNYLSKFIYGDVVYLARIMHDLATHSAVSILALAQNRTHTHISSLSSLLFVPASVLLENLLSAWARLAKCSHPEKTLAEPGAALWASPGCCPIILLPPSSVSLPTTTTDASFLV